MSYLASRIADLTDVSISFIMVGDFGAGEPNAYVYVNLFSYTLPHLMTSQQAVWVSEGRNPCRYNPWVRLAGQCHTIDYGLFEAD